MSTPRKLGVALCLLGFAAVCALALTLNSSGPFAGLGGIEDGLENAAAPLVESIGGVATADGRDLTVELPEVVEAGFDRERLADQLRGIDGVRNVELIGMPVIAAAETPAPEPTAVPDPTAVPEPTAVPDPTAVPEPTEEPTPESTPEPEPTEEPTPAPPSLEQIVAEIDLGDVNFAPGTARLTAQDTAVLDGVADQLQGISGGPIQVQAHTDNVGDPDVNLLLSQDRADAVVTYLIDRGVDASLLTSRGFGAQEPIADNSTEQGRAANQRVALVVEGN